MSMRRIVVGLILCTAALSAQDSGSVSDSFYAAIRANDLAKLDAMLAGGADPNVADPRGGATPLMYAAVVGSVDAMTRLVDKGADVNAANSAGATALMWAASDVAKVRLLLDRGADAKAVSKFGRTPLALAALNDGSADVVRLLLAKGADPKAVDGLKSTVLHAAAGGNDTETIRQIVDAGLEVNAANVPGFTPLMISASQNNLEAVRLLLAKGANVNAVTGDGSFQKVKAGSIALGNFTPLLFAAPIGSVELVKTLLDAGANVNVTDVRGMTPLMLAVANDRQNAGVIRSLIDRGSNVNAKSLAGETALDWARKNGSPVGLDLLTRAGAVETKHEPAVVPAPAHSELRDSVEKSVALLRQASVVAAANGGCASCHSHNVVDTLERAAVRKGLNADEKLTGQRQTLTKAPYFSAANLLERLDPAGSPITTVFALTALANSGYQPDRTTDMVAAHLATQQARNGRWFMSGIARPPIGEGPIAVTAYAIRALKAYAPPGRAADMNERIARATAWLAAQKPITTEDRNMQLLGLLWAGRTPGDRAPLVKQILAKQRADGGWSQTDHLQSDAYATGVSLFALAEAGGVAPDHAAFKKGVAYLLSSQRPDGSWYVKSRAVKFQPYFDGGFPYDARSMDLGDGHGLGGIGACASAALGWLVVGGWWLVVGGWWLVVGGGTMSRIVLGLFLLCTAVLAGQERASTSDTFYSAIRANDLTRLQTLLNGGASPDVPDPRGGATPLMYAAAIGTVEAMTLLLDKGADANASNSGGATALMWAATDISKVKLLLSRGADAKAMSQRGRTALFIAARNDSSSGIVKLLMAAGADPRAGDAAKMTVLHSAAAGNDTDTIRLLVDAGADVNAADALGFTPLIHSAGHQNIEAVKLLLAKGANVNAVTGAGFNKVKAGTIALGNFTPLTAASLGSPELIKVLLDAGADVNAPDARGLTALMLAVATDKQQPEVVRLLLAKGAQVNAKSSEGETALDWARKIGAPQAIALLERAGGTASNRTAIVVPAPAHVDLKASIDRSRTLLGTMSAAVAANGACASCHSHNILDIVDRAARSKRLPVDASAASQRQLLTRVPYLTPANILERFDVPGFPDTTAFALVGLASSEYPPDRITDAIAVRLAAHQARDGHWPKGIMPITRPPIEDGTITTTAMAGRALASFAPPARRVETDERLARARSWLAAANPRTTEDRNMQLLGLLWAGAAADQRARLAENIIRKQRADGGWAQSEHLTSDAYATGESLVALAEAGGVLTTDDAYQRGVRYLLSTQRADGSWHVSSRSPKFQPYFDGGFPYEHDQWISAMATGWATAALTLALP